MKIKRSLLRQYTSKPVRMFGSIQAAKRYVYFFNWRKIKKLKRKNYYLHKLEKTHLYTYYSFRTNLVYADILTLDNEIFEYDVIITDAKNLRHVDTINSVNYRLQVYVCNGGSEPITSRFSIEKIPIMALFDNENMYYKWKLKK